jgi:hypothetical protein
MHRNHGIATAMDKWRLIPGVLFIARPASDPTSDPGSAAFFLAMPEVIGKHGNASGHWQAPS